MAAFGMQNNPLEGFRGDNTQVCGRASGWNVDMTNPGDSRVALNRNNSMPSEFGSPFELYDASQSKSPSNQFEDMQFQMRMVMQMMERFMQYMEAMLRTQMGGQSVGDRSSGQHCDHADGGHKSVDDGGIKPGNDGGTKPVHDDGGSVNDGGATKYADTGVKRGRTIYRDDFSGSKGDHPNSNVFDTQHIGPDGLTRQRGASIQENAMISDNNTVMDGNGHLQLFADKQRTLDPKTGEYVDYTKGSFNTGRDAATNEKGLTFNLKDHPNGIVIETRAKHPTNPGAKFDALWIMTDHWAADPAKGEKKKDTIEYDAAEGGGAGITVHYPVKDASGKSVSIYGGGAHRKLEDGKFHTYTVSISHNGDVVEYIDGKQAFAQKDVFPTDKELHLKASLEVSPKWTGKKYTGDGGLNSDGAGMIDYLDVSELKP